MDDKDFERARQALQARLVAFAQREGAITALWLQGSLATGEADDLSDIDAHLAIEDEAFEPVSAGREALLQSFGTVLAWSDATTPGLEAAHVLFGDGVRLDLVFERDGDVGAHSRPPFRMLFDKKHVGARLRDGWSAPRDRIGRRVAGIVRMTRQGGAWPVRVIRRGQWATFAMMELDLVNAQIAQLMAVRADPALFFQNVFSVPRRLPPAQQQELERLTDAVIAAVAARDLGAALASHLEIFDALVREGRAACEALDVDYPLPAEGDAGIRRLLLRAWPQ